METPNISGFLSMDTESFERISTYVTREYGIKLPSSKKSMLESRLNSKVKSLGLPSYKDFLDFIFSEKGKQEELFHVIDLITTNKTDFFREAAHIHFLTQEFLPSYKNELFDSGLNFWSAGCSSGEEPYTISMAMEEYSRQQRRKVNYRVLASDVSTRVMQVAYQGVYDIRKTDPVPLELKINSFLQSKSNPGLVRVKSELREKLMFKRINLMDCEYPVTSAYFDVIFCRNVLIYFDKLAQERVINQLCRHLKPGGILFLGHSESIIGMNVPLKQIRPTIYRMG